MQESNRSPRYIFFTNFHEDSYNLYFYKKKRNLWYADNSYIGVYSSVSDCAFFCAESTRYFSPDYSPFRKKVKTRIAQKWL